MQTTFHRPTTVKQGAAELLRSPWRFSRILPGFDADCDEVTGHVVDRLRDGIKITRIAGMTGQWHYSPDRLIALRQAYVAARVMILRDRAAMREAA